MPSRIIADRLFGSADQEWFASVSGDRNPMHMDALAARRTMAGFPVVHGVHTLLWALDNLCRQQPPSQGIAGVKADFERMVYVGDHASLVLVRADGAGARLEATVNGITVMGVDVAYGSPGEAADTPIVGPVLQPARPLDLTFDQMTGISGTIPPPAAVRSLTDRFPFADRAMGAARLAGLACSSFLVGMVCPGLHSIYRNLNLATVAGLSDTFGFRVKYSDDDYKLVRIAVSGAGWAGSIDTFVRPSPCHTFAMVPSSSKLFRNGATSSRM